MTSRSAPPPKRSCQAVLIVDMINDFRFDDGKSLFRKALPVAKAIVKLRERADNARVPVVYVNDNFAKWHDTFLTTIETIERSSDEGREIVSLMRPAKEDYYVLKPNRSGFYKTPLEILLADLKVTEVIVTGVTTDMCVLFTAHDAYMRGLGVTVPRDCTAAIEPSHKTQSLKLLERVANADTRPADEVRFHHRRTPRKKN
jgi:nicotinamidase-related amidase